MKTGIIGLPQVGKTSLFRILTKASLSPARANPREAARALAHVMGGDVVFGDERPTPTMLERAQAKLAQRIGPEAAEALALPLIQTAREIAHETVAPLRGHIEAQQNEENLRAMTAGIRDFASKVDEWDEDIEKEMAKLVPKFLPGPGTTLPEYLSMLYAKVTARRGTQGDQDQGPRARRASRDYDDEPARGERIRPGMDPRKAVEIAVRQAEREYAAGARGRRR